MDSAHVLVTGAAGLVGSAACRCLARDGVPFTAVWHGVEPDFASKLRADLSQPDALESVTGATAIVHAAAVLPSSLTGSERVAAVNRAIDDLVLARARAWQVPVVYVSGTSLYRAQGETPLSESAPIAPVGSYLEEKARTEELGAEQAAATGTRFTALRVSAPYGRGQRAQTVIQRFVAQASAGEPLEYYGTGSREQDFTWADDVGTAIAAAVRGPSGIFNVATGRPVTMRSLAQTVAAAAGLEPSAVRASGKDDPQEGTTARFDVSAAERELGWTATTALATGIALLIGSGP